MGLPHKTAAAEKSPRELGHSLHRVTSAGAPASYSCLEYQVPPLPRYLPIKIQYQYPDDDAAPVDRKEQKTKTIRDSQSFYNEIQDLVNNSTP